MTFEVKVHLMKKIVSLECYHSYKVFKRSDLKIYNKNGFLKIKVTVCKLQ